jgi:hypothetical protein
MRHNFLIGAVFVAIVLVPCVIALLSEVEDYEKASDWNVLDEGFI